MHRCIFTTKIIVCRLWKIKLTKRMPVLDWAAHMGSRRCNKCAMNNMQTSDGGTQHCKTGTTTTAFKKLFFSLSYSSLSYFTNSLDFLREWKISALFRQRDVEDSVSVAGIKRRVTFANPCAGQPWKMMLQRSDRCRCSTKPLISQSPRSPISWNPAQARAMPHNVLCIL